MKHRSKGKKLNRDSQHRSALLKNLSLSLFEHGSIKTTEAKAKALSRYIDKLITTGKKKTLRSRRDIAKEFGKRQPSNLLTDHVAPQLKRTSGFTRIVRLGNRQGDDTMMARVELIDYKKPEVKKEEVKKVTTKKTATKPKTTKKASSSKAKASTKKQDK